MAVLPVSRGESNPTHLPRVPGVFVAASELNKHVVPKTTSRNVGLNPPPPPSRRVVNPSSLNAQTETPHCFTTTITRGCFLS